MTKSNLISDLKSQNKIIDECYRFLHMKMRSGKVLQAKYELADDVIEHFGADYESVR